MKNTEIFDPFSCSVQMQVDENRIGYVIEMDVFGNVYSAESMFFDLPDAAKKISVIGNDDQLEKKINAYAGLFSFIVPLVLAGQLSTYQEPFEDVLKAVKTRLSSVNMSWEELFEYADEDTIAGLALIGLGKFSDPRSKMRFLWDRIGRIIEKMRNGNIHGDLRYLAESNISQFGSFFMYAYPLFPYMEHKYVLKHLSSFKSEKIKQFLIQELKNPHCHHYASGLIYGLLAYDSDMDVYHSIVDYYDASQKISAETLEAMCDVLINFNTSKSIEIGYELLHIENKYSAPKAFKLLFKTLRE